MVSKWSIKNLIKGYDYDCAFLIVSFRGDLQFLLTNITVYIIDFLVPAVLVTKYYWDFTVEVRRRSGGGGGGNNQTGGSGRGTGTGGRVSYSASIQIPNGMPPADSQPQTVPGNQSAAHPLANNPNGEEPI